MGLPEGPLARPKSLIRDIADRLRSGLAILLALTAGCAAGKANLAPEVEAGRDGVIDGIERLYDPETEEKMSRLDWLLQRIESIQALLLELAEKEERDENVDPARIGYLEDKLAEYEEEAAAIEDRLGLECGLEKE